MTFIAGLRHDRKIEAPPMLHRGAGARMRTGLGSGPPVEGALVPTLRPGRRSLRCWSRCRHPREPADSTPPFRRPAPISSFLPAYGPDLNPVERCSQAQTPALRKLARGWRGTRKFLPSAHGGEYLGQLAPAKKCWDYLVAQEFLPV